MALDGKKVHTKLDFNALILLTTANMNNCTDREAHFIQLKSFSAPERGRMRCHLSSYSIRAHISVSRTFRDFQKRLLFFWKCMLQRSIITRFPASERPWQYGQNGSSLDFPNFLGKIPYVLSKSRICFLRSKDKTVLFKTGLSRSGKRTQNLNSGLKLKITTRKENRGKKLASGVFPENLRKIERETNVL